MYLHHFWLKCCEIYFLKHTSCATNTSTTGKWWQAWISVVGFCVPLQVLLCLPLFTFLAAAWSGSIGIDTAISVCGLLASSSSLLRVLRLFKSSSYQLGCITIPINRSAVFLALSNFKCLALFVVVDQMFTLIWFVYGVCLSSDDNKYSSDVYKQNAWA